jgi:hypothetical protein
LFLRTNWVRLEVIGGRVAVVNKGCGQSRSTVASSPASEMRQSLSVQLQPSALLVNYEAVAAGHCLSLEVDASRRLTIRRSAIDATNSPEVCYVQPDRGDVTLLVASDPPRKLSAASLWHLALAEPEACREHLFPLLESLRPTWRLGEQASAIEAAVFGAEIDKILVQTAHWQRAVDDLASADFRTRQAADRELRTSGQAVVAFLGRLDESQLDREQRRRIRAIGGDLLDIHTDSPERVAAALAADKTVWLALLQRDEVDVRLAAAEHLTRLCRRSLPFDPQAGPLQRQEQLAKLIARLSDQ